MDFWQSARLVCPISGPSASTGSTVTPAFISAHSFDKEAELVAACICASGRARLFLELDLNGLDRPAPTKLELNVNKCKLSQPN